MNKINYLERDLIRLDLNAKDENRTTANGIKVLVKCTSEDLLKW